MRRKHLYWGAEPEEEEDTVPENDA
jgi:hypothetical protein